MTSASFLLASDIHTYVMIVMSSLKYPLRILIVSREKQKNESKKAPQKKKRSRSSRFIENVRRKKFASCTCLKGRRAHAPWPKKKKLAFCDLAIAADDAPRTVVVN